MWAAGYRIIDIPTGYRIFLVDDADEYVSLETATGRLNVFEEAFFGMTPLPALFALFPDETPSLHEDARQRVWYGFEQLGKMPNRAGPKFVYAHFETPHPPFVFGANGEARALDHEVYGRYSDRQIREFVVGYRDQIQYINGLVIDALTQIVRDSDVSPVIILQGDHGLRLFKGVTSRNSCLIESFAILNALRLPGIEEERLYPAISPVNTFRLIFDSYFGTEFGLLPDRSFFSGRRRILKFEDITGRAESCTTVEATPNGPVRIRR